MRARTAAKESPGAPHAGRAELLRSRSQRNSPPRLGLEVRLDPQAALERAKPALDSAGSPLAGRIRGEMESRLRFDFSRVRIHTGEKGVAAARALGAEAFTSGTHVVFGAGRFDPHSEAGRQLLAHELGHVVQQGGGEGIATALDAGANRHEAEAERVASGTSVRLSEGVVAAGTIQRKISMRDVGKGEQSGFAKVPDLIARMNGFSTGLTYAVAGGELTYTAKPGGKLSNFDMQMQGFIDQAAVLPLRFTNRSGLLGDKATGFHDRVLADEWSSGYVDIDDLLASSDLGLQTVLVHFLRERTATPNYEKRIGSPSLDTAVPAHQAEFDRAHAKGIQAEVQVLQDFFGDLSIRFIPGAEAGDIARVFRNSRKDTIRSRVTSHHGKDEGVDAVSVEVITRDGVKHTPEEYKAILAAAAAPVHNEPGGSKAAGGSTIPP